MQAQHDICFKFDEYSKYYVFFFFFDSLTSEKEVHYSTKSGKSKKLLESEKLTDPLQIMAVSSACSGTTNIVSILLGLSTHHDGGVRSEDPALHRPEDSLSGRKSYRSPDRGRCGP